MYRNIFLLTLLGFTALSAQIPMMDARDNHKIGVQNSILAKVNGTTISMMDVKKKMDLLFHQNYPHLIGSGQARFQFYEASWRNVLMEMIDNELVLADAADKEVKVSDAEVREEIENRFGPNVMTTLDKIGISYEETWRLIQNEMIVRRMTWWFIQSKAMTKVTPQEIRQAYKLHIKENPPYTEWTYRVLTVRGEHSASVSNELYQLVQEKGDSPENLAAVLKEFESAHPDHTIAVSNEFKAKDIEVSESHRAALSTLQPHQYSKPISQLSRDKTEVCRLFYLGDQVDHPAPSFEELSPMIKNQLIQKASGEVSHTYIEKLRKHYRFDQQHLTEMLPSDFQPFAIQ